MVGGRQRREAAPREGDQHPRAETRAVGRCAAPGSALLSHLELYTGEREGGMGGGGRGTVRRGGE